MEYLEVSVIFWCLVTAYQLWKICLKIHTLILVKCSGATPNWGSVSLNIYSSHYWIHLAYHIWPWASVLVMALTRQCTVCWLRVWPEKKVTEADLPKNIDFTGLLRMKCAHCSLHSRAPVNMHCGRLCGWSNESHCWCDCAAAPVHGCAGWGSHPRPSAVHSSWSPPASTPSTGCHSQKQSPAGPEERRTHTDTHTHTEVNDKTIKHIQVLSNLKGQNWQQRDRNKDLVFSLKCAS